MKVLKRFQWSKDGINTSSLAPGDPVPRDMPADMVGQLMEAGYLGEQADAPTKATTVAPSENKDMGAPPENKDHIETEVPVGYEDLDADDMKTLALKLTGRQFTTKTAAKKVIADVESRRSSES